MSTRRYAERTRVSESKSRADIEAELRRHDCDQIAVFTEATQVCFGFVKENRMYRFGIELPVAGVAGANQERRRLLRTMFLYIKGRLNAVEDGLKTFEDEFLPNAVLADGHTVIEHAREQYAAITAGGDRPTRLLLPGATST